MKLLIYVIVIGVSLFIGYRVGQKASKLKTVGSNISPVIDEIQLQLNAIRNRLINNLLTVEERESLQLQEQKLINLLNQLK